MQFKEKFFAVAPLFFALIICFAFVNYGRYDSDTFSACPAHQQNTSQQATEKETTFCLTTERPRIERLVRICVTNNKILNVPHPIYPQAARAARIEGDVITSMIVDEEGKVIWAEIIEGHPILRAAVKEVVCEASFTPTTLSGQPVKIEGIFTYKFRLE